MTIHTSHTMAIYSATVQDGNGEIVWFDSGVELGSILERTYHAAVNAGGEKAVIVRDDGNTFPLESQAGKAAFLHQLIDSISHGCHLVGQRPVKAGFAVARMYSR